MTERRDVTLPGVHHLSLPTGVHHVTLPTGMYDVTLPTGVRPTNECAHLR